MPLAHYDKIYLDIESVDVVHSGLRFVLLRLPPDWHNYSRSGRRRSLVGRIFDRSGTAPSCYRTYTSASAWLRLMALHRNRRRSEETVRSHVCSARKTGRCLRPTWFQSCDELTKLIMLFDLILSKIVQLKTIPVFIDESRSDTPICEFSVLPWYPIGK